jgi:hypothetical protein
MMRIHSLLVPVVVGAALTVSTQTALGRVDVRVEVDKTFDFKPVRTWSWNPQGAGDVKMARTQEDDPEAMKRRAEPLILDAVAMEMARLKLEQATSEPDLTVTYYLLLSTNMSAQTMGQFLPPVAMWGIPPFSAATQSLKVMNRGSLVLDLSAKGTVVWRGLAQTDIRPDTDDKKRESVLREGVRDLLRRYPVRS